MFSKRRQNDKKALTPDEALAKAQHFCAYRERSPHEVRQKIKEMGLEEDIARQIYEVLEEDGFFNEKRFADAFAGGKFRNNHWGRVRIRMELQMRRIAPALIEEALEGIDEGAYQRVLQELAEKKVRQLEGDEQARSKAAAYLIRAGFEPERVFGTVNALFRT